MVCSRPAVAAVLARGLPVVDLRALCSDPADHVLDIEPAAAGGARIAAASFRAVTEPDAPSARIFGAA